MTDERRWRMMSLMLATGGELSPDAHWGPETNGLLRRLGFTIGLGAGVW